MVKKMTRREARLERQRQRQRRRKLGAVGLSAVVLLVAGALTGLGFFVHHVTSGGGKPPRGQTTLLVSLVGDNRNALATALLAHDVKSNQGLELLVPARVIVDTCGFGSQQFGNIVSLPDGSALARSTLAQVLGGVIVDGSWTVSTGTFARLVDLLGGVTVDVDTDIIQRIGTNRVVVVPKGNNERLTGLRAVQFATYVGPGEDPNADLPRFQSVLQAVIDALPPDPGKAAALFRRAHSFSTLSTRNFIALLHGLAADDAANNLLPTNLPVVAIDSGGALPSYRVDDTKTQQLVSTSLGRSWPASARGHHTSVLIQNGVGRPGLVGPACARLLRAGYVIAGSGNASSFNHPRSQVIVFDTSVATARLGNAVAHALRLPGSDVLVSNQGQNVADVVVILGRDFRP
jgi:hypothetical protein